MAGKEKGGPAMSPLVAFKDVCPQPTFLVIHVLKKDVLALACRAA